MSETITVADLLPFTSRDRNRSHLSVPFVLGDHTYGCNGHFACRIPGRHVDTAGADTVAALVGMFDTAFARPLVPFEPVIAEVAPADICWTCRGNRFVIDCDVCEGSGEHTCSDDRCDCTHECGACYGKGAIGARQFDDGAHACDGCGGTGRKPDESGVFLGDGLALMWRYLATIQALPGPIVWSVPTPKVSRRFCVDDFEYGPVAFSGSGWQAIILPRRTHGSEAITALRHEYRAEPVGEVSP